MRIPLLTLFRAQQIISRYKGHAERCTFCLEALSLSLQLWKWNSKMLGGWRWGDLVLDIFNFSKINGIQVRGCILISVLAKID